MEYKHTYRIWCARRVSGINFITQSQNISKPNNVKKSLEAWIQAYLIHLVSMVVVVRWYSATFEPYVSLPILAVLFTTFGFLASKDFLAQMWQNTT
jgi:uncharacterized protein YacL